MRDDAGTRSAIREHSTLADLVDECERFHADFLRQPPAETLDNRRKLAGWIRKFHSECGTLTSQVEEALGKLDSDNCLLLMTAHQPNLLAYSGVLRKATLNQVVEEKLSERLHVPVVSFFGLADQDFTDDRWVRSALLPDVERKNATLELRIPMAERVMLCRAAKPSETIINRWAQDIENWIHRKTKSVALLSGVQLNKSEYMENLRQLWSIVAASHDKAGNCADFNAYIISKIVNDTWRYDTLFCRFSECQQIFKREFSSIISRFWQYSDAVREVEELAQAEEGGVASDEHLTVPVWYHCQCGSKARLNARKVNEDIIGQGDCPLCGRRHEIDFSQGSPIWNALSEVSARALPMPLVFFEGLGVCSYVGGAGGRLYLQQASHVANKMGMTFPPVVTWRPHDRYLGLAQLEALLTVKKLTGSLILSERKAAETHLREKLAETQRRVDDLESLKKDIVASTADQSEKIEKIKSLAKQQDMIRRENDSSMMTRNLGLLDNSKGVMRAHPCIVDYAVSLGLRNVSEQWQTFLKTVGKLSSDITLAGKTDQQLSQFGLQSSWPSLVEDLMHDIVD